MTQDGWALVAIWLASVSLLLVGWVVVSQPAWRDGALRVLGL